MMKVTDRSIELKASIKKSEDEIKKINENMSLSLKDDLIRKTILKKFIEMDEAFLAVEELNNQ